MGPALQEVYFVQGALTGLIKIGVSSRTLIRIAALATTSPDRLTVLGVLPCWDHGRTEQKIHEYFDGLRVHGEWFSPAPGLTRWIEKNAMENWRRIGRLQRICDNPGIYRGRRRKLPEKFSNADRKPLTLLSSSDEQNI